MNLVPPAPQNGAQMGPNDSIGRYSKVSNDIHLTNKICRSITWMIINTIYLIRGVERKFVEIFFFLFIAKTCSIISLNFMIIYDKDEVFDIIIIKYLINNRENYYRKK